MPKACPTQHCEGPHQQRMHNTTWSSLFFVKVRIGKSQFFPGSVCRPPPNAPIPHTQVMFFFPFSWQDRSTFGYLPPLRLVAQALPDGIQHILWAFSHMLPELADANVDIKAHHVSGSTNLNSMCTAAEPSDDDTGGNGDGDRANSQSMPTPLDTASDVSELIVPSLAGFAAS